MNGTTIESLGVADPASRGVHPRPRWKRTKPPGRVALPKPPAPGLGVGLRRLSSSPRRSALAALLCGVAVGVAFAVCLLGGAEATVSPCGGVDECRAQLQVAEGRLSDCLLMCGEERTALERAKARFRRFKEAAVLEQHYDERRAIESREREERQRERAETLRRQRLARAEAARAEHRRRVQLERLRQAHVDRQQTRKRERRVALYRSLGVVGRSLRLRRCQSRAGSCDELLGLLTEAASGQPEQAALRAIASRAIESQLAAVAAELPPSPLNSAPTITPPSSHGSVGQPLPAPTTQGVGEANAPRP